jgi:surface antigen
MVAGKLLILTASSPAFANDINDPKFFNYRSGSFSNRLADLSFGWFKTLNTEQKIAYNQAMTHALMYSDNGQTVRWYKNDASGMAVPSATWSSGNGYCRRLYVQAIAHGVEKTMKATACFNEADNRWTWYN